MLNGSQPFWITRIFAGLVMFAGFLCFVYNICDDDPREAPVGEVPESGFAAAYSATAAQTCATTRTDEFDN